jgi:hypothetical protein
MQEQGRRPRLVGEYNLLCQYLAALVAAEAARERTKAALDEGEGRVRSLFEGDECR